jgi:hypothetical protein
VIQTASTEMDIESRITGNVFFTFSKSVGLGTLSLDIMQCLDKKDVNVSKVRFFSIFGFKEGISTL